MNAVQLALLSSSDAPMYLSPEDVDALHSCFASWLKFAWLAMAVNYVKGDGCHLLLLFALQDRRQALSCGHTLNLLLLQ